MSRKPTFKPCSTDLKVLQSDATIIFLSGVPGTGKSSITFLKIVQFVRFKMEAINGIRRARVLVVRTDQPKLETTTMDVFRAWVGNDVVFHGQYPKYTRVSLQNDDGTISDIEFVLRGLPDNAEEIANNLAGLPANVLWINEVQTYSTPAIVEYGFQRMGRYLSKEEGNNGHKLVLCDFNRPNISHWLKDWEENPPDKVADAMPIEGYDAAGDVNRFKVEFIAYPTPFLRVHDEEGAVVGYKQNPAFDCAHKQPAGMSYWAGMLAANSKNANAIQTNLFNEYGFNADGIPVYNGVYSPKMHVSERPLELNRGTELLIGCDPSGFRGAAVAMQLDTRGIKVFKEFCEPDESISFYELLHDHIIPWIRIKGFDNDQVTFILDPSNHSASDTKMTPRDECRAVGFNAYNAPTNDPDARIESLRYFLLRNRILIDNTDDTAYVRSGLQSEYYWKKLGSNVLGKAKRPEKTKPWSDVVESIQYSCSWLRRGESRDEYSSGGFSEHYGKELITDAGVL